MGTCRVCGATSACIGRELGVCLACIRRAPDDPEGVPCAECVNACRIPVKGFGLPSN